MSIKTSHHQEILGLTKSLQRSKQQLHLIWLRRDLRLNDLATWEFARQQVAKNPNARIQFAFVFDPKILDVLSDRADRRVAFLWDTVCKLQAQLRSYGSDLWIFHADPIEQWQHLKKCLGDHFESLTWAEDYEPTARERDHKVHESLTALGVNCNAVRDHLIFSPGEVVKADGSPYSIYTPFSKMWLNRFAAEPERCEPLGPSFNDSEDAEFLFKDRAWDCPDEEVLGFSNLFQQAKWIESFAPRIISSTCIEDYQAKRDRPDMEGTSLLGIHLRFGTLSPRLLLRAALGRSETFVKELIWREFFQHILWFWPESAHKSWRGLSDERWNRIAWRDSKDDFERWKNGETGYGIVDAGMRQLRETGWMHNRVRMITACFLTKQLLLPWQWGERYMASLLLDFDLGANVGNWQWAAGTGCDAAPWFRVFNPILQEQKFDPEGLYRRTWLNGDEDSLRPPMIELKWARERCLTTFREALGEAMPPTRTAEI